VITTVGLAMSRKTVIVSVPVLPAVSVAVTVIVFEPATSAIPNAPEKVVPVTVAVPDFAFAAFDHPTLASARLSEALTPRATDEPVVT
jgi:hypothetical protein